MKTVLLSDESINIITELCDLGLKTGGIKVMSQISAVLEAINKPAQEIKKVN